MIRGQRLGTDFGDRTLLPAAVAGQVSPLDEPMCLGGYLGAAWAANWLDLVVLGESETLLRSSFWTHHILSLSGGSPGRILPNLSFKLAYSALKSAEPCARGVGQSRDLRGKFLVVRTDLLHLWSNTLVYLGSDR